MKYYKDKDLNSLQEKESKKRELMTKLNDLNKKYSPSKSQLEPEKQKIVNKTDFYESPKTQVFEKSSGY